MLHKRSARRRCGVPAVIALMALLSAAALKAQPAPGPLEAGAAVPPPDYRSAFDGYRRFNEPPRIAWPEANATVDRVGGHAGALADQPGAPVTPPAAGGHKH